MDVLQLHYALGRDIWPHVALALLMVAPSWWAAARLSAAWRRPMHWAARANALQGAGVLLASLGQGWGPGPGPALAELLQVGALLALWRASALFCGAPPARREQQLWLLTAVGLVLALGHGSPPVALHDGSCGLQAMVAWRGAWLVGRQLRRSGGVLGARSLQLLGLALGSVLMVRALGGFWLGLDIDVRYHLSLLLAYLAMPAAFGANLAAAYHVFGRVLQAVERLSCNDPRTGLHQRSTVEQVLAFEAACLQQQGQRLAMLALRIDDLAARRQAWGPVGTARVMGELARLLRMQMSPTDVMGQTEDGVFLLCLLDTVQPQVHAQLRSWRQAAAEDPRVRAAAGRPVLLQAGMVMVARGDDIAAVVDVARARCLADVPPAPPRSAAGAQALRSGSFR